MANVDQRYGLKPVRYLDGKPYNGAAIKCYVSANYATALFIGDPVDLSTTLADKDPTAKYQTVVKATAGDGNYILGAIIAIEPDPTNLSRTYIPASTGGYVYVAVASPNLVFRIRDDGAAALTSVAVGQNAVLIFTHAGDTATGLSGVELDTNSDPPAADASNQLLILGLADVPNNELAAHAEWDVLINQCRTFTANGLGVTAS